MSAGRVQTILGIALVLGSALLFVGSAGLTLALLGAVGVFAGSALWVRGRRISSIPKEHLASTQDEPIVLLLRPFQADESHLRSAALLEIRSQEEQLARALRPIGRLVAIGKPGQSLPDIGAQRLYPESGDWKSTVEQLVRDARLIIIRAGKGAGPGIEWEVNTLVRLARPEDIVIHVWMWRPGYTAFSETVRELTGWDLPSYVEVGRLGRVHGVISFDASGEASFAPGSMPFFRRSLLKVYQLPFYYALKPTFERLGVAWRKPPVNPFAVLVSLVTIMASLLALSILA